MYGYAGGDPVNYSDPFGLCIDEDKAEEGDVCRWLVSELQKLEGEEFQRAAAAYDLVKVPVMLGLPGSNPDLRDDASGYGLGKAVKEAFCEGGGCGLRDVRVTLNMQQPVGDFLITAVHESYHLNLRGNLRNSQIRPFERAAWSQLPPYLQLFTSHYRR